MKKLISVVLVLGSLGSLVYGYEPVTKLEDSKYSLYQKHLDNERVTKEIQEEQFRNNFKYLMKDRDSKIPVIFVPSVTSVTY